MLKQIARWTAPSSHSILPAPSKSRTPLCNTLPVVSFPKAAKASAAQQAASSSRCSAGRRARYGDEAEDEEAEDYGHNQEIAMLESYSESARGEALLVHATVDEAEVEVLIFKGFSSCLSYATSPDPSSSVIPKRAIIKLIDRIKGRFDPSNIEYLEKGLTWETFKGRLAPKPL